MMKKRIGNDIHFTWHIYRKDGDTQVPESFTGKEVEVKLISPLQRPVTIEDVTIATGVVTFTFRGKHQVTLGNYVAVLLENKGEDGMVTLDVVDAVTLVPHSYMEEDGDEGDVIEASSVELESSISAGAGGGIEQQQADWAQTDDTAVDFIKNKPNLDMFARLDSNNVHTAGYDRYRHEYEQIDAETTIQGDGISSYNYNKDGSLREMTSFIPGSITLIKDGVKLSLSYRYFANLVASIQAKADVADLASLVNTGTYNSTSKKIELKHDNNVLAEIDATAFIKDGMVNSVVVQEGYIVITFNTDAGKEAIRIPVTDIFDPSNYYDKDDVDGLLAGKVDKIVGKGLSTNDYTTADKDKLIALPTASELSQQLGSKANSADLAEVATSGSYNDLKDKPDLSAFITKSVDDLTNYYLKSETYTKTEVQQLIGAIQQFHYEVYPTLPQTGASNVLYLIGPIGTGADKYEEYVYANNDWTKIGDTSIDLSGYVTTEALTTALADYVTSSALSTALAGKEDTANKKTTIAGNEGDDTYYPSTKAVAIYVNEAKKQMLRELYLSTDIRPDSNVNRLRYNDTGADIIRTAEWGERVVHKAGHYWLNGLGDITEDEMSKIYSNGGILNPRPNEQVGSYLAGNYQFRTNLNISRVHWNQSLQYQYTAQYNSVIRVINLGNNNPQYIGGFRQFIEIYSVCKAIIPTLHIGGLTGTGSGNNTFYATSFSAHFMYVMFTNIRIDCKIFKNTPLIMYKCLKYLVDNAANTSAITITVHATTYGYLTDSLALPAEHSGIVETAEDIATVTEEELVGMKEWDETTKKYVYATKAEWQQIVTDATAKNISFASA